MADGVEPKEATTEDFTTINPETLTPELQTIYKSMQADYTRKTQAVSQKAKEFETKEKTWEEKLIAQGALEQEVQQWRGWYAGLSEKEQAEEKSRLEETTPETAPTVDPDIQKYLQQFKETSSKDSQALKDEIAQLKAALKTTSDQTGRMFNYHAQLVELGTRYPGLNKKELLDYALKTGQPDLESAYKTLHQDDMIESEVTKRLEERLKTERTKGIRGPGQQIILRRQTGGPKTFDQANELILQERAAQGL